MEKKGRKTNIELLRVLAIFMIILHHFSYHNELYTLNGINTNIGIILFSFGKIGVNIFVIITGYFMIEKNISLLKIIKLWLQVFLYSVGIATIYFLLNKLEFKEYIRFFFPITFNKYWFFSSYILLYLLIPLINKVFTNLDRISYKKVLKISTFVLVIWFSIAYQSAVFSLNDTLSAVLVFCYLYTLGGYIKKYGIMILDKCSFRKIFIITLIGFVFFELMLILANSLSFKISFFKPFVMYYNRQNSIFTVTLSTLLFYLFKTLNIKNNKFLNIISKTTFGIYLIQSHSLFGGKKLYKNLLHSTNFYDDKKLLFYAIFACLVIMIIASLIDLIRIYTLEKLIINTKVKNKIEKLEHYLIRGNHNENKT